MPRGSIPQPSAVLPVRPESVPAYRMETVACCSSARTAAATRATLARTRERFSRSHWAYEGCGARPLPLAVASPVSPASFMASTSTWAAPTSPAAS